MAPFASGISNDCRLSILLIYLLYGGCEEDGKENSQIINGIALGFSLAFLVISFAAAVYTGEQGRIFYGLNFLNMWPCFLALFLYLADKKLDFKKNLHVCMFPASFSPFISEFLSVMPARGSMYLAIRRSLSDCRAVRREGWNGRRLYLRRHVHSDRSSPRWSGSVQWRLYRREGEKTLWRSIGSIACLSTEFRCTQDIQMKMCGIFFFPCCEGFLPCRGKKNAASL